MYGDVRDFPARLLSRSMASRMGSEGVCRGLRRGSVLLPVVGEELVRCRKSSQWPDVSVEQFSRAGATIRLLSGACCVHLHDESELLRTKNHAKDLDRVTFLCLSGLPESYNDGGKIIHKSALKHHINA